MMTDYPSSAPIQLERPQYNSAQATQALGGFDQEFGSNEHLSGNTGIGPAGPYPAVSMNHASAARYSSTMPVGYDDVPHLAPGPGGHQGIQNQHQLDVHPTPGMTHCIPFALGPPRREYYASAFPEVPNNGLTSQVPLPYNVAGPFRGSPSIGHSRLPVTEDLRIFASRYLHNPSSRIVKLRMKRSRSGGVEMLICLVIPVASGQLRLEQYAPAIPEVSNDRTPSHVSLLHSVAGPSQGDPGIGHPESSGIPVAEDLEDLRVASRYLHKPGSRVDKVRVKRRDSGTVKVLILLKIDDTM